MQKLPSLKNVFSRVRMLLLDRSNCKYFISRMAVKDNFVFEDDSVKKKKKNKDREERRAGG